MGVGIELESLTDADFEIARKAVEDVLIDWRDSRLSELGRRNGLAVYEKDGTESCIIRFGMEVAMRIGVKAIVAAREAGRKAVERG
jgi:hypothetical protein